MKRNLKFLSLGPKIRHVPQYTTQLSERKFWLQAVGGSLKVEVKQKLTFHQLKDLLCRCHPLLHSMQLFRTYLHVFGQIEDISFTNQNILYLRTHLYKTLIIRKYCSCFGSQGCCLLQLSPSPLCLTPSRRTLQHSSIPRILPSPSHYSCRFLSLKMEGHNHRGEWNRFQTDPDSFEAPPST